MTIIVVLPVGAPILVDQEGGRVARLRPPHWLAHAPAGVIGTLQALEAIKMLAGIPSSLSGKLRLFDGKQQSWSTLQLSKASTCLHCGEPA